jgi:hypothetical protein
MYEDYNEAHPASAFDQATLKRRGIETLEQLPTGTSNKKGEPATIAELGILETDQGNGWSPDKKCHFYSSQNCGKYRKLWASLPQVLITKDLEQSLI